MRSRNVIRAKGPVTFLPWLFGVLALAGSITYRAQRLGVFVSSSNSLERFIQHHVDGIAAVSSLAAFLGIVTGLVMLRVCVHSPRIMLGTMFSAIVFVWSLLGLSR